MRLTDLLQLTNDLNKETAFYLTIQGQTKPLAKLKISSSACTLYPGSKPVTKGKLTQLVKNLHGRSIPIYIQSEGEKLPIYGIQIQPEKNAVCLT